MSTHTTRSTPWRRAAFWLALLAFIAWDARHAAPFNVRLEPPIIAAGSGQAVQGGHCAVPR